MGNRSTRLGISNGCNQHYSNSALHRIIARLIAQATRPVGVSERLVGATLDRLTHRCHILEAAGESHFGSKRIPNQLEAARKAARQSRTEVNRNNSCRRCEPLTSITS